jgi:hypothetical protein
MAYIGVTGSGVTVAVDLPQAARPAMTINRPQRVSADRRKDSLILLGLRFINPIIQQVYIADEISSSFEWDVILFSTENFSFGPYKTGRL